MAKKTGRPTAFRPDFVTKAEELCRLGATDREVAEFLGVSVRTVYRWQHEHPGFCQALKVGKEIADDRVERSLYHRALGYSHDAVKIFMPANADAPVYAPYVEHFPPDTAAASLWLRNRRPAQWRDKQDHEFTSKDGQPLVPILNVTLARPKAAPEKQSSHSK